MNRIRNGASGLLVFCLAVKAAAWLVAPLVPLLIVSLAVLTVFSVLVDWRFRR